MTPVNILGFTLPWVVLGVGCWIGYQLIRQNGRILLRLEAIERHIETLKRSLDSSPLSQLPRNADPVPAVAPPPVAPSLAIGSPAPIFELPDLFGVRHALSEWRGRRLLLVFFNPQCGFCTQMAPDLAAMGVGGANGGPMPLVITTGQHGENRQLIAQYGIGCPVMLQQQMEVASDYLVGGTPMGYAIDEQGLIASQIAVGAQALLQLARPSSPSVAVEPRAAVPAAPAQPQVQQQYKGNRQLSESKIERSGLEAGTPAPSFRLARVGGGELSLEQYRGQRVLLVFSDPHCGPCDLLAPQLERLHRERPDLQVLMISRGDAEENRQKLAQQGVNFPVVLQRQWEISHLYGMFATPIGYLIDEDGVIVVDVAVGADPILALANRQIAGKELVRQ